MNNTIFFSQFQVFAPRFDDRVTSYLPGYIILYKEFFYVGLNLPLYPFIRNVLDFYRVLPT